MDMTPLQIIAHDDAVTEYLAEHELEHGFVPLEAVLLQMGGTTSGLPAALLVVEIDGCKVLIKTPLKLLLAGTRALNGVVEDKLGKNWIGP